MAICRNCSQRDPTLAVIEVYNVAKDLKPQSAATGGLSKSAFAVSPATNPASGFGKSGFGASPASTFAGMGTAQQAPKPGAFGSPGAFSTSSNAFGSPSTFGASNNNVFGSPQNSTTAQQSTQAFAPKENPFAKVEPQAEPSAATAPNGEASNQPATQAPDTNTDDQSAPSAVGMPTLRPSSSHSRLPDGPLGGGLARGARRPSQSALPVPAAVDRLVEVFPAATLVDVATSVEAVEEFRSRAPNNSSKEARVVSMPVPANLFQQRSAVWMPVSMLVRIRDQEGNERRWLQEKVRDEMYDQ